MCKRVKEIRESKRYACFQNLGSFQQVHDLDDSRTQGMNIPQISTTPTHLMVMDKIK